MPELNIELSNREIAVIIDALDSSFYSRGLTAEEADYETVDTLAELRALFSQYLE